MEYSPVEGGLQLGHTGNLGWVPYVRARTKGVNEVGSPKYPVVGGKYWVTTGQPARIRFEAPGLSGTPNGVVSFTVESIGGNGIARDDSTGQRTWWPYCTLIYSMPGGKAWNRNNTGALTIRRVNAIAQDNLKGNNATRGYAQTGSYVLGGSWGGPDQNAVRLLIPSGSVSWDQGVTANAGKFPGGNEVQFLSHNRFFWEEFTLGLRTRP